MSESTVKFVIGTIATAIVIPVINYQLQATQLEVNAETQRTQIRVNAKAQEAQVQIARIESDRNFVARLAEKHITANLEERMRFSRYFACMLKDKAWDDYCVQLEKEYLEDEQKKTKAKVEGLQQQMITTSSKPSETQVEAIIDATTTLTLLEDKSKALAAANPPPADPNGVPSPPVASVAAGQEGWCFVGIYTTKGWGPQPTMAVASTKPVKADALIVITNVHLREDKPDAEGKIARALGAVKRGARLPVLEVYQRPESGAVWVKTSVARTEDFIPEKI